MNRVLSQIAGSTATPPNRPPSLPEFMRQVTPQQAKRQIEEMIASGQVTRGQVEALMGKAQEIARQLGIK